MLRVGIVGATGYTALEAARWIVRHPEAEIVAATSRAEAGSPLSTVHPSLSGQSSVTIELFDAASLAERCDVVLSCLPHGASAATVRSLIDHGTRVIDFSADFRLSRLDVYEAWYGVKHPWPERVGATAYGMPEFFAKEIQQADVVANPGCYPSSAIYPLVPLVQQDLVELEGLIIDSKSGVSGAGRSPKLTTLYCEANESISAYSVGKHRHQPEIEDLVARVSGHNISVIFTPHLTPMDRGILSTIYVQPKRATAEDVMRCWSDAYGSSPFIQPVAHLPATGHVRGTNFVQMTVREAGNRLILVCAIDNLAKGASGAAVQNMNVMFGLDEACGLL